MANEKTAWVLLRGLGRESGHWLPFIDEFRNRFPGDEVLPIDLPGVGEFRDLRCPHSMYEIFRFVRGKAVERARSMSQFKVVALSLGGMVAMEWMAHKPEDLAGCVLLNSSTRGVSPVHRRLRWEIWPHFVRLFGMQAIRERERKVLEIVVNDPAARERALPQWTKVANDRGMSRLNFLAQLFAASQFEGLHRKPEVDVLLLSGLGDKLVDPECSEALHRKWDWPLERHPWGGHDLVWDDAQWVLDKIHAWNSFKDTSRH